MPAPDVTPFLHEKHGFCHPDWQAIGLLIEEQVPETEWHAAWEAASREWVTRLRDTLGGDYQLHETPNFLILSAAPLRIIRDACASFEKALQEILSNLEGVALDEGYGKHVVLMFESLDEYYAYLDYFYPEGDHPMSSGVCLSGEGYVHFAFPTVDYSSYRTVLVHELTHACLGDLPIPLWLNEALAMRMEQVICGTPTFHLDKEIYDKHLDYWDGETIQQFWSGHSWSLPGDSNELSYNLAQILWRKIETDLSAPRDAILEFAATAHYGDAGEAAFQEVFELGLEELMTDFLGEGPWEPDPTRWADPIGDRPGENRITAVPSVGSMNIGSPDSAMRLNSLSAFDVC
ncbi:MAG: hypothetical protein EOP85_13365 [Verrucomicrobiaceae bacterium]|nr:MAG: hypothetical protein EOP85_13365 [Verrucomicrobiaceae bacterium]